MHYFDDIRKIVNNKEIINTLLYNAIIVEYQSDLNYKNFNVSEFDQKVKTERRSFLMKPPYDDILKYEKLFLLE